MVPTLLVLMISFLVYLTVEMTIYQSLVVLVVIVVLHLVAASLDLSKSIVLLMFVPLALVAIAQNPNGSDLWIYHSYGRTVAEYSENPYVATPDDFPNDPVTQRVLPMYRSQPAIYGPVFVAGSVAVAAIAGDSSTYGRLAWQMISFLAVLLTALLLRKRVLTEAVALFLLSPITVYLSIHQAHNDVFVGLAIFVGCAMAQKNRCLAASLALTMAALIKAPSGIALVVFLLWLLMNRRVRDFLVAMSTACVIGVACLAPFGGRVPVVAMLSSSEQVNATSIWNFVRGDWESFVFRPVRQAPENASQLVSVLAVVVTLVVVLYMTWRSRNRPIFVSVTLALSTWIVLALHSSAWYYGWVLPIACLWPRRERLLIFGLASLYFLTTQAWLMPVAARLSDDGQLGIVDRSAAVLLGLVSILGLLLLRYLGRSDRIIRANVVPLPTKTIATEIP